MRVRMFYPLTINDLEIRKFDNILSFCVLQNHWCEYIEGDLSFLCVIAGYTPEELTPKYPDYIKERVLALYDATYWWYEYGLDERIVLK